VYIQCKVNPNAIEYLFLIQIKNSYGSITGENKRIIVRGEKRELAVPKKFFFFKVQLNFYTHKNGPFSGK